MNALLVQEVIDAVRATPEEQLGTGMMVDPNGCLCSLGVYAYRKLPDFQEHVDQIRANGDTKKYRGEPYRELGYEALEGSEFSSDAQTLQAIVRANDSSKTHDPEGLKNSILGNLQKLHDRIINEWVF